MKPLPLNGDVNLPLSYRFGLIPFLIESLLCPLTAPPASSPAALPLPLGSQLCLPLPLQHLWVLVKVHQIRQYLSHLGVVVGHHFSQLDVLYQQVLSGLVIHQFVLAHF